MSSDADDLKSYSEGTSSAGAKWLRKYEAKASVTLDKLKSEETWNAWQKAVTDEKAKKAAIAKAGELSTSDLVNPAKERGKTNYGTSTGAKSTQEKWARNSKPYRDAAKEFSKNKKPATTNAERIANMTENMENMQRIKDEKIGA